MSSGVAPSCGARPRVSTRSLRPTRAPPTCAPLSSNRHCQETSPRPHLEGYSVSWGEGGFVADTLAIRRTHPSHTRRGASWLLQENVNSRTVTPLCSHVWCVSEQGDSLYGGESPENTPLLVVQVMSAGFRAVTSFSGLELEPFGLLKSSRAWNWSRFLSWVQHAGTVRCPIENVFTVSPSPRRGLGKP